MSLLFGVLVICSLAVAQDAPAPAGALAVHVSDEDLGFVAPTTVVFDGSDMKAFRTDTTMVLEDGILKGSGKLSTKQRYGNFHVKIRIRHTEKLLPHISLMKERVPIFRSPKESKANVGEWLELEFLYRQLPGERSNIRHLNQGFVHEGSKGRKFHDDNLHRLDQFPRDERGYITPSSRGLYWEFPNPVEISRIEITPLVANSPREVLGLVGDEKSEFVDKGAALYKTYCVNCHGNGIDNAPNPLARSFAKQDLQNGSSQLAIYKTLTTGFNTMPPMTVLTPEERHQVAAYIREEILKPHRPESYKEPTEEEIGSLPHPLYTLQEAYDRANKPEDQIAKEKGYFRDHGPVIVNAYGSIARNGAHIRLPDEVAVSYDLHTLNLIDVRTDGYLDMLTSQEFCQRPSTGVGPSGQPVAALGGAHWVIDGEILKTDLNRAGLPKDRSVKYFGHYVNGDGAILSYQIHDRKVMNRPSRCERAKT
ncbi:MAG: c-type cytochrome [Verrucomicrobiota bacterium]